MRVLVCLALVAAACALQNGLALTPQMGWNSWCGAQSISAPLSPLLARNHFACNVNESIIRATADAFVSRGLAAAGYQYVVRIRYRPCSLPFRHPSPPLLTQPFCSDPREGSSTQPLSCTARTSMIAGPTAATPVGSFRPTPPPSPPAWLRSPLTVPHLQTPLPCVQSNTLIPSFFFSSTTLRLTIRCTHKAHPYHSSLIQLDSAQEGPQVWSVLRCRQRDLCRPPRIARLRTLLHTRTLSMTE